MTVTRDDLEKMLVEVAADVEDPRAGVYGPASLSWEVSRESVLFVGAGRATLMQLAHPFVAHAIDQHSYTRSDPLRRFRRTFASMSAMAFGDLDHVLAASRRVHAIHSRYEANQEEALMWVYATLIDTIVQAYELTVRPLSLEEKERHYREKQRFARLFGIPDSLMPADWTRFLAYVDRTLRSEIIAVGPAARALAGFLFTPPTRVLEPFARWYRMMTAGMLPPRLRSDFGFSYGRVQHLAFGASIRSLLRANKLLPPRLRYLPAYLDAQRRLLHH